MLRDSAWLLDIKCAGQLVVEFSRGMSREDLELDKQKQSAILHQIQIAGEATKRLSREFREQHPQINWSQIAGMRDIIVHQYDRLDFDIVWQVIQQSIPEMLEEIASVLPVNPEDQ